MGSWRRTERLGLATWARHQQEGSSEMDVLPDGAPDRDQTVTADEAVRLIRDGDSVVVGGFLGACFPDELMLAIEERFQAGGAPRDLTLVFPVAAGDAGSRGLDRLAHPGLVRRAIGGHWTLKSLSIATAVHNANGLVIVQVERVAERGTLHRREAKIPELLVDCVVVASPDHHWRPSAPRTRPPTAASLASRCARSRPFPSTSAR